MKWIQAALLFCVAATLVSAQCPGEMPAGSETTEVHTTMVLPLDFPSCSKKQINSVKVSSSDGSTITVDVANNMGGISMSGKSGKTSCYNSFGLENDYPPYGTGTAITVTCENAWYDCPIQYYIEYETCETSNDDNGGEPVPVQDIDCQFGYVADAGAKCVGDGEDGTCASDGYGSISESLKIYTQPTGNGKACPTKTKQAKKCPMDICPIGSSDDSKLGLYIGVGVGGLAVVVLVVVGAVTIQRRRAATRGALTHQLLQEEAVDIAYVESN